MTDLRRTIAGVFISLGLLLPSGPGAFADSALFSFGEMRQLQQLPADGRPLSTQEAILHQNMQFYAFTVFETLLAANNAAYALQRTPLFCAPEGTFRFKEDGDIARLTHRLTAEILETTGAVGADDDHYDDRPASEALLLALRAAFPCSQDVASASGR
jgi:hypothetical protein